MSADHGVTAIPEQLKAEGKDGGRIDSQALFQAIETAAQKAGAGRYVAHLSGNDVYFLPGMFGKLTSNKSAVDAVLKVADSQPGIAHPRVVGRPTDSTWPRGHLRRRCEACRTTTRRTCRRQHHESLETPGCAGSSRDCRRRQARWLRRQRDIETRPPRRRRRCRQGQPATIAGLSLERPAAVIPHGAGWHAP